MFDSILKTVTSSLTGELKDKVYLDERKANDVAALTADSFKESISEKASMGEIGDIVSMFSGGESGGGLKSLISNKLVSNLISKLGIPEDIASKVSGFAVPFIIEKFMGEAKQKGVDNEAGITSMLSELAGDSLLGNVGSKLKGLF